MRGILKLTAMTISCLFFACTQYSNEIPDRPANMPEGSTFLPMSKGAGLWQACWVDKDARLFCRISNRVGSVFQDGSFIVYRGKGIMAKTDLQILPIGGTNWICLSNGTILIPKDNSDHHKSFLKDFPSQAESCPL